VHFFLGFYGGIDMYNTYGQSINLERINNQIQELEKLKTQIQQPVPITQNFQIAPTNNTLRYANSITDVERENVIGDTPYFSKDMSVVWIKNSKGEIKSYQLEEIIQKDAKDIQIELLQAKVEELAKEIRNNGLNTTTNKPSSNKKPASVSQVRDSKE
jgi:hypothetical protein